MSRKKEATAKQTTRQLIGIDEITDSGLKTSHGRLIFFAIKPTNLSVQPPEAVSNRIYALMTVLKGQAEIEMLALNSKESFEDNKRHYRQRAAEEDLPVISRLLEADAKSLDRLQIQMATAVSSSYWSGCVRKQGWSCTPTSPASRKASRIRASRQASPAARISSACWACILSRMPPRKNMRITTGNAGSF